ncbi:receptor-type tyrosine-protein phosphatase zeta [Aplysia californica]|uniref:protein-tyrosine-phosphatase n=1 Tax=Aplysia californica TaxID=6500 RepID=A0ABM0ZY40_APLCA|nr:receptor-type tyrosine-protein phosphatase zeta [Aplysia californica]
MHSSPTDVKRVESNYCSTSARTSGCTMGGHQTCTTALVLCFMTCGHMTMSKPVGSTRSSDQLFPNNIESFAFQHQSATSASQLSQNYRRLSPGRDTRVTDSEKVRRYAWRRLNRPITRDLTAAQSNTHALLFPKSPRQVRKHPENVQRSFPTSSDKNIRALCCVYSDSGHAPLSSELRQRDKSDLLVKNVKNVSSKQSYRDYTKAGNKNAWLGAFQYKRKHLRLKRNLETLEFQTATFQSGQGFSSITDTHLGETNKKGKVYISKVRDKKGKRLGKVSRRHRRSESSIPLLNNNDVSVTDEAEIQDSFAHEPEEGDPDIDQPFPDMTSDHSPGMHLHDGVDADPSDPSDPSDYSEQDTPSNNLPLTDNYGSHLTAGVGQPIGSNHPHDTDGAVDIYSGENLPYIPAFGDNNTAAAEGEQNYPGTINTGDGVITADTGDENKHRINSSESDSVLPDRSESGMSSDYEIITPTSSFPFTNSIAVSETLLPSAFDIQDSSTSLMPVSIIDTFTESLPDSTFSGSTQRAVSSSDSGDILHASADPDVQHSVSPVLTDLITTRSLPGTHDLTLDASLSVGLSVYPTSSDLFDLSEQSDMDTSSSILTTTPSLPFVYSVTVSTSQYEPSFLPSSVSRVHETEPTAMTSVTQDGLPPPFTGTTKSDVKIEDSDSSETNDSESTPTTQSGSSTRNRVDLESQPSQSSTQPTLNQATLPTSLLEEEEIFNATDDGGGGLIMSPNLQSSNNAPPLPTRRPATTSTSELSNNFTGNALPDERSDRPYTEEETDVTVPAVFGDVSELDDGDSPSGNSQDGAGETADEEEETGPAVAPDISDKTSTQSMTTAPGEPQVPVDDQSRMGEQGGSSLRTTKAPTPATPDIPISFVELKLSMSWPDFCDSEVNIWEELLEIVNDQGGQRDVTVDQIQMLNRQEEECVRVDIIESEEIFVRMYLTNKSHHYDRGLTIVCAQVLEAGPQLGETSIIRNKLIAVHFHDEYYVPRDTDPSSASHEQTPKVKDQDDDPFSDPGVTVAVTAASIGSCICLVIVLLQIIIRRRHSGRGLLGGGLNCSFSVTSADSIQLSSVTKSRPNSGMTNMALEMLDPPDPTHPLNVTELTNMCTDQYKIDEEYQKLPNRLPRLSVVPDGEEDKNRYANVLPLVNTRVKLLQDGTGPRSTYINANYVTGPDNECQYYIATQAPTEETIADFWTMIWQQDAKAIVMLTQMEEDGQERCAPYWPELSGKSAAQKHGHFQVELKHKEVSQEYIMSTLEINNLRKIEKRQIKHFWYTCWPMKGTPEPISLVKLVLDTRPAFENKGSPLIVHCSPGTGRTCTFIALDLCMRQFESRRLVDVMKTVNNMRHERAGAIQNKEQYNLVYNAINEYATILVSPMVSAASSATTLHALLPG